MNNLQDLIRDMPQIQPQVRGGNDFMTSKILVTSLMDFLQKQLPKMTLQVKSDDSARLSRDIMDLGAVLKELSASELSKVNESLRETLLQLADSISAIQDFPDQFTVKLRKEDIAAIQQEPLESVKVSNLRDVIDALEDVRASIDAKQPASDVRVLNLKDLKIPEAHITVDTSALSKLNKLDDLIVEIRELAKSGTSSMQAVMVPPTPGNVLRDTGISFSKALTDTPAVKLFSSVTEGTRIDISALNGPIAVGFDADVSAAAGSEKGTMIYPGNIPYQMYISKLSNIYVAGANGRRVCGNYFG